MILEIALYKLYHCARQQEEGDQVRDGHQPVECLRHAPEQAEIGSRSDDRYEGVDDHEGLVDPCTEQKFNTPCPVESPAENGRKRKAAEGDRGKYGYPVTIGGDEAVDRELGACVCSVADGDSAAQDDKGCHGADYDRVGKYLEDAEKSLFYRMVCIGGRMGDGAGTESRFIGEDSSGNAFLHAQEKAAHDSACHGGRREGAFEDGSEHAGHPVNVQEDHAQRKDDVEQRHERHEHLCDSSDPLDPA